MLSSIVPLQRFPVHYQREGEMARINRDALIAHIREEQQLDANGEVIAENSNHDHQPETAQATVARVVNHQGSWHCTILYMLDD